MEAIGQCGWSGLYFFLSLYSLKEKSFEIWSTIQPWLESILSQLSIRHNLLHPFCLFHAPASFWGRSSRLCETHGYPERFGLRKEKLTHFRLYWPDIVDGPNPTAVTVMNAVSNSSNTKFGRTRMIDKRLTLGPQSSSKLLARAQGFYAAASQDDLSFLMAQNFTFVEGKYNGSSIALMGRNSLSNKVRELSVIGGSGLFRFARGNAVV